MGAVVITIPARQWSRAAASGWLGGCGASLPIEASQPVVRRIFVSLAPCRDSERRLNKVIEGTALAHEELPDMDELASQLAHNVHAQHDPVRHTEDELDQAIREARDARFGVRAKGWSVNRLDQKIFQRRVLSAGHLTGNASIVASEAIDNF